MLRKINTIISVMIVILFIIHGVLGASKLIGWQSNGGNIFALTAFYLLIIHIVIGIILTWKTISNNLKTGVWHLKENKKFWIRRISGFVIIIVMFKHFAAFDQKNYSSYTGWVLLLQIIFMLALFIHVKSNIKPLLCSLGLELSNEKEKKIINSFLIILFICCISAAVVYMFRR